MLKCTGSRGTLLAQFGDGGTILGPTVELKLTIKKQSSDKNTKGHYVKTLVIMLALSMTGAAALAQDAASDTNTSTLKASEVKKGTDRKDIDEEITNARLRAETGSKSKWSFASNFTYSGAAINNPTSTKRPQLNDGQASADPTKLSGQVSVKYRINDHDNLNVGLGVDYTPSYERADKRTEPSRYNASSPYVSYSRVFKAGDVQNVLEADLTKYTAKEDIEDSKLNYEAVLSHTAMAPVGTSKAEIGLYTFVAREFYQAGDKEDGYTLYQIGIDPVAEYAVTDNLSLRTVSRWLTWSIAGSGENEGKGMLAQQTQSIGVGYAITRDVYVYPNMQWKWTKFAADATTIGFTTYINL